MIATLLSLLGGGVMRLLPELVGLWNKRSDNAHELAMLEKQFQLESTKAAAQAEVLRQQGDVSQVLALLEAQKGALESQGKSTGLRWVDGLNALVRPLTTYYFLALFGLAKIAMFAVAMREAAVWDAMLKVYTPDDLAMLSGILSFWFVGRVFDKNK